MPAVRPTGELGPLGLMLPTAPQGKLAGGSGSTTGTTYPPSATALAQICTRAEASGAGALWATDHLFWPRPMLECLTTLAVAATATERVPLGSCVLQLPLRHPAAVAKQATALQLLSGGRFVLGLGVGSHQDEYEQAGVDFHGRGHLLDQGIEALHRAWAADDGPAPYRQLPPSAPVPVWLGGSSAAARRRAARVGDGWVPLFLDVPAYAQALGRLRDETEAAGRDPAAVTAAVVVFVALGESGRALADGTAWLSSLYSLPPKAFERHLVAGSAPACAERVAGYLDAGAEHVVVMVADDRAVEQFSELSAAFTGAFPGAPSRAARPDLVEVRV